MRLAKRAVTVILLAVTAGCTPDITPALPPTEPEAIVTLYHTRDTSDLLERLENGDFEADIPSRLDFDVQTYQQLMEDLETGHIQYFVTHHLPANAALEKWSAPLARDGIAIIRHPDNPVTNLSLLQVRQIYRGFISNWGDLGGDEQPVIVYSHPLETAISLEFGQVVMGQQQITPNARIIPSSTRMIERLQADPQGIGFIPVSALNIDSLALSIEGISPTVDNIQNNLYPLRMTIYVVGGDEPTGIYRDFILWIQSAGQELLEPQFAPLPH